MRIFTKMKLLLLAVIVIVGNINCYGQTTLAGWNMSGQSSYGTNPLSASTTESNITVGQLTKGSGMLAGGTASSRAWGAGTNTTGWQTTSSTTAISNNSFFTFTIKPNDGYLVSLNALSQFDYRRSGNGAQSGLLQYKLNSGSYADIATVSFSSSSSSGASIGSTNLSSISALQNIPSTSIVTIRIVLYSGSSGGAWYIYDKSNSSANDFVVTGTVTSVSVPTITTQIVSSVGLTTATGNGNITATGGANATARGFCWDLATNADPDINDSKVEETGDFSTGAFVGSISSLSVGTQYKVRAYATNSVGTNYGDVQTFTTLNTEPTNHITGFTSLLNESTVNLSWIDATGAQLPAGYLIKGSTTGFNNITAPVDGTTEADGGLVKNVTQGTQTATITGLNAGTSYYFKIYPYTNSGSAIDYKLDGSVPQATATTENLYFRSKVSGNWSATSSWEKSTNGTSWTDATAAPSNAASSVNILAGHHITVTANATSSGLTLAPTAQLTLNNGFTLDVTGNIILQSQEDTGTATFVDANAAGGLTVSGSTTVQQYLTGSRNWYVSSPVASAPRNVFSTAATHLYEFNEATGAADGTWQELTIDATALGVGQGYVARIENAGTVTFTGGNLNTGTISLTDLSVNSGDYAGFHLIGNPYPSFLDWDQAPRSNMMSSVWFRTRDNASTPAYVFDTYGVRTGEGTNNNGRGTVSKDIPPMQAFWTRANSSTNGIQFTNAMRSHQSQTEDKRLRTRAQENQQVIRLEVKNNQHSDEAILVFNSDASDGFDDFDSPKKSNNNVAIPEIYTMAGNEQVAINGMQNIVLNREIALGFKTGTANDFTLRTSAIRNLSNDIVVFLKDRLRGTEVQLTPETAYSFSSDTTNTNQRFSIIFRSSTVITGVDQIVAQTVAYINKNHQIVVNHKGFNEGMITVTNALGQELLRQKTEMNCTTINKTLSAGVYFVSLQNSLKKVSRKVIIN